MQTKETNKVRRKYIKVGKYLSKQGKEFHKKKQLSNSQNKRLISVHKN